jgi:hypothetical protein
LKEKEEVERVYKYGWINCETSYATLKYLNMYLKLQMHKKERMPRAFKEIRIEYNVCKVYLNADFDGGSPTVTRHSAAAKNIYNT